MLLLTLTGCSIFAPPPGEAPATKTSLPVQTFSAETVSVSKTPAATHKPGALTTQRLASPTQMPPVRTFVETTPEAAQLAQGAVMAAATGTATPEDVLSGIREVLQQEMRAWENGDAESYQALLDLYAENPAWRIEETNLFLATQGQTAARCPYIEQQLLAQIPYQAEVWRLETNRQGNLAMAIVFLDDPDSRFFDRSVARFYRRTVQGWLRTSPQESFWGNLQRMDTPSLRWIYRERDAQTVEGLASEIDRLYRQLHEDLGLPQPFHNPSRVSINLPDRPCRLALIQDSSVLSPGYFRPDYLNPSDTLKLRLAQILVWKPVLLAAGGSPNLVGSNHGLPDEQSWNLVRGVTQFWQRQWAEIPVGLQFVRRVMLYEQNQTGLDSLENALSNRYNPISQDLLPAETVAVFIERRYGKQALISVLQAISRRSPWDLAIQNTLEIDLDTFESGWRNFVMATYHPLSGNQP
jgi:hypothetical protein